MERETAQAGYSAPYALVHVYAIPLTTTTTPPPINIRAAYASPNSPLTSTELADTPRLPLLERLLAAALARLGAELVEVLDEAGHVRRRGLGLGVGLLEGGRERLGRRVVGEMRRLRDERARQARHREGRALDGAGELTEHGCAVMIESDARKEKKRKERKKVWVVVAVMWMWWCTFAYPHDPSDVLLGARYLAAIPAPGIFSPELGWTPRLYPTLSFTVRSRTFGSSFRDYFYCTQ